MSQFGTVIPLQTSFVGSDVVEAVLRDAILTSLLVHHSDYQVTAGGSLGPELIVNGGFDTDTVWSKDTAWSISGGVAVATGTTPLPNKIEQDVLTIGKTYRCVYDVVSVSGPGFKVRAGTTIGTARTAVGTYSEDLVCAGNGFFGIAISGSTTNGSVDNASAKEVLPPAAAPQGWTLALYPGQSVDGPWASKPDFGPVRVGSIEFTSTDVATGNAIGDLTLAVTDASSISSGSRVLVAPGTARQQLREVTGIASNTMTFSERLTKALSVSDKVYVVQSLKVDIPQLAAPYYKVQLVNQNSGSTDAFVLAHGNVIRGVELT